MPSLGQRGLRRCRGPQGHCPRPSPGSPAPLALLASACCLPSGCVCPSKLPSCTRPWQAPPPGPTPTHPSGLSAAWRGGVTQSTDWWVPWPLGVRAVPRAWVWPLGVVWRERAAGQRGAQSPAEADCSRLTAGWRRRVRPASSSPPALSAPATDGWSFWRRPCGTPPGAQQVPLRSPIPRPRAPRHRRIRAPHPAGTSLRPLASSLQATCLLLPSPSHLGRLPRLLSPYLAILGTTRRGLRGIRSGLAEASSIHPPRKLAGQGQVPKPYTSLFGPPPPAACSDAGGQEASETSPLLAGRTPAGDRPLVPSSLRVQLDGSEVFHSEPEPGELPGGMCPELSLQDPPPLPPSRVRKAGQEVTGEALGA